MDTTPLKSVERGTARRQVQPPSRLTYEAPGNPSSGRDGVVPFSTRHQLTTSSVQSTASSATKLRRKKAEAKKKLVALQRLRNAAAKEVKDQVKVHERKLKAAQKQVARWKEVPPKDEGEQKILRLEELTIKDQEDILEGLQKELQEIEDQFQEEKQLILDDLDADCELTLVDEEENEQFLDSDDEAAVRNWDKEHAYVPGNETVPVAHFSGSFVPPARTTNNIVNDHSVERQDFQDQLEINSVEGDEDYDAGNKDLGNFTAAKPPSPIQSESGAATVGKEIADAISHALHRLSSTSLPKSKLIDKDLPEFSGKAEEWLVFRSEYDRTTKKYGYDDSENVVRLRKFLTGKAKDRVTHLLPNPLNCSKIMEKLEKLFGRADHVLKSLIANVTKLPPPDINRPVTVIDFGTAIDALVTSIQSYKEEGYFYDKRLLEDILKKVPAQMKVEYGTWVVTQKQKRDLRTFNEWMDGYVTSVLTFEDESWDKETSKRRERRAGGFHSGTQEKECVVCHKGSHPVFQCPTFKTYTVDERKNVAKMNRLCFNCLGKGCAFKQCKSKGRCRVDGCGKAHNTLLHFDQRREEPQPALNPSAPPFEMNPGPEKTTKPFHTLGDSDNLPVIQITVRGPSGELPIYALIDSAAFTMIEEEVAEKLGLDLATKSKLTFSHHGVKETVPSSQVTLEVGPKGNGSFHKIELSTVPKLRIPPRNFDARLMKQKYPYLQQMKAQSMRNARAQIVIGNDLGGLYVARQILEGRTVSDPCAVRCLLGWYVAFNPDTVRKQFHSLCRTRDAETFDLVKQHFQLDSIGIRATDNSRSSQDKKALERLEKTTHRKGDRWETGLLWRENVDTLPESKTMATKRLFSMEKKMDRNKEVAELCTKRFEDYIEKGFLKKKEDSTTDNSSDKRWYLPWFFAFHPSKKPRLVFDAAAKSNGKSFNDFIASGPDLIHNLAVVLTRFRLHQVPLVGDIKEMFHQVQLREEDKPSQTILYRGMERNNKPTEYEMQVLFFGSASSPCSAIYTKDRNASEFVNQFPKAVEAIQTDMYVDDYLGGGQTVEEVIQLRKDMNTVMDAGGFPLLKWNSTSPEILHSIPEDLQATTSQLLLKEKEDFPSEKTLGVGWNTIEDNFFISLRRETKPWTAVAEGHPTKRQVVSLVMSIFDPLGFLSPLKFQALLLIQELWRSHRDVDWDDQIPPSMLTEWRLWLQALQDFEELRIPRKLCNTVLGDWKSAQLHIFSDASSLGYAACAYLRIDLDTTVEISFLIGKARVAPVKGFPSIPKGELQAALISSRLEVFLKKAFQGRLKFDSTILWCDSKTVLTWIRSTHLRFPTFVSNRVEEILDNTDVSSWRYVPSKDNVADDGTRAAEFELQSYRWIRGPDFLSMKAEAWPKEDKNFVEVEASFLSLAKRESEEIPVPDVTRFSNWFRLVRATATVLRFIVSARKEPPQDIIKKAVSLLIRRSQDDSFPEEKQCLLQGKPLPSNSRLKDLDVELDSSGTIVLRMRIPAGNAIKNTSPPVLDSKHRYTQLFIEWHHRINGHFGRELLLSELRKEVWILNARKAVKTCFAQCLMCKERRAQPQPPQMAQLPASRVDDGKPVFHYTGVDYFGPFLTKHGRKLEKRWGVIFTCLTTRAVHLELAESLDTHDFIQCLTRFVNLRGMPSQIWSDNGTNFVGAERELREAFQEWNEKEIQDFLQRKRCQFFRIPAASPHMGGSWERMIRSTKRILYNLLTELHPTADTLRTLLAEVTGILNSRPLTFVSGDPDDPEPITPNHLLNIPCVIGPTFPGNFCAEDLFKKSWRHAQFLASEFWKRWRKEYLPTLAKRQKWIGKVEPLKPGDIVIVLEDNAPRNQWKKGIVLEAHQALDGQVRSAQVLIPLALPGKQKRKSPVCKFSTVTRPAVKLCRIHSAVGAPEVAGRKNVASPAEPTECGAT